jgi:acyl-CoA thioester hydrolase
VRVPAADGWPFAFAERVRFGDLDAMRHLNNVEFLRFFETARIAFMRNVFPAHDPSHPSADFGLIFAEAKIAYRAPGQFDDLLRTSIRPAAIARSSFRMEFEMHVIDGLSGPPPGGRLIAEGHGVLVGYDYTTSTAARLPAHVVAALTPLLAS